MFFGGLLCESAPKKTPHGREASKRTMKLSRLAERRFGVDVDRGL